MEIRTVIAKHVGNEHYVAILHWGGGIRFQAFGTVDECYAWFQTSIELLMNEFEIVFDNKAKVQKRLVETL